MCSQPRKMSLAACISRWPSTTRWPWFAYSLVAEVRLEHRRLRLLDLQEERVVVVAAEQQHDPAPRADAADADDLAGEVDDPELLEQVRGGRSAASRGTGAKRSADHASSRSSWIAGLARRARRPARSAADRETMRGSPSTIVRQLRERLQAVLRPRLRGGLRTLAACGFACCSRRLRSTASSTSRRAYQTSRLPPRRELPHRLAVRADGARARPLVRSSSLKLAVAAGDLEARREPLHVPLERAGQRLVEVVEVEDERALGRREAAEVREVRVAAELHARARRAASPRDRAPSPPPRRGRR